MKELVEFVEKKKWTLGKIAFYQAFGFITYAGLVSLILWNANKLFGNVTNFWGPLLFLTLFVFSALISALIVLGYPFILFWEKKDTMNALKLVIKTAEWLFVFLLVVFAIIIIF